MTELKIKQADINNNGNQSLMGEIGGGGGLELKIRITLGGVGECVRDSRRFRCFLCEK